MNVQPSAPTALRAVPGEGGLTARGLGKRYRKRPVVRNVSISLRRGEAVGLLGPNGAGKTTTFYMITGLVQPDEGTVSMDGHDVTRLPMYRRARLGLGYLPQEASIFRGLNVEDNIRAALEVVEPVRDRREQMLDALLAEFGIAHLRRTPALALSGGERRRCEIARALATHPSYILLDEPLAGIDPIAVGEIRDLVKHLKDRGIGVLITDHNVRETLEIIDRAYILHEGQVLMEGVAARHRGAREGARRSISASGSACDRHEPAGPPPRPAAVAIAGDDAAIAAGHQAAAIEQPRRVGLCRGGVGAQPAARTRRAGPPRAGRRDPPRHAAGGPAAAHASTTATPPWHPERCRRRRKRRSILPGTMSTTRTATASATTAATTAAADAPTSPTISAASRTRRRRGAPCGNTSGSRSGSPSPTRPTG